MLSHFQRSRLQGVLEGYAEVEKLDTQTSDELRFSVSTQAIQHAVAAQTITIEQERLACLNPGA